MSLVFVKFIDFHAFSHSWAGVLTSTNWVGNTGGVRSLPAPAGRATPVCTLLGWATPAWFGLALPVIGFAVLDLACACGDGFHRGLRAWASVSSPTGSFLHSYAFAEFRCRVEGPRWAIAEQLCGVACGSFSKSTSAVARRAPHEPLETHPPKGH